jgi:hypothetical protein
MSEDQRRLTFLRENVDTLAEEKNALESILWNLKNSSEDESSEILRRIRAGVDPQSLVQQIQASRSLTQVKGDASSSGDASRQYIFSLPRRSSAYFETVLYSGARSSHGSASNPAENLLHTIATSSTNETDEIVRRLKGRQPVDKILEAHSSGTLLTADPERPEQSEGGISTELPHRGPFHIPQARPMVGNALAPMAGNALAPMLGQQMVGGSRAPDAHTPPNVNEYR